MPDTSPRFGIDDMEIVLVGTTAALNGNERLLAAFRPPGRDDQLVLPVEHDRCPPEIAEAAVLYVRPNRGAAVRWNVASRSPATSHERAELDSASPSPIGENLDILWLESPVTLTEPTSVTAPDGRHRLVVLLDGSERGGDAVEPAVTLADILGLPLSVLPVIAGTDDRDTLPALRMQLDAAGQSVSFEEPSTRADLAHRLPAVSDTGAIVVSSAYGRWMRDARLCSTLSELVADDLAVSVGVGPHAGTLEDRNGPIIVAIDDTPHAEHVVGATGWLAGSTRPLVLTHATTPASPEPSARGSSIAKALAERLGLEVRFMPCDGDALGPALNALAERLDAPMIVMHHWHHPHAGKPVVSSASLGAVAGVGVPVAILCDA